MPTYPFAEVAKSHPAKTKPLPLKVFLFQIIEANAWVSEMILYH